MYKGILINGLSGIGDSLYYLPVIGILRKRFKDAFITLLNYQMVGELFRDCPCLDELIIYEEEFSKKGRPFRSIVDFFKERRPYDLYIDFAPVMPWTAYLGLAIKAKRRLLFKLGSLKEKDRRYFKLYTDLVEEDKGEQALYWYLRTIRVLGIEEEDATLSLRFSEKEKRKVIDCLNSLGLTDKDFLVCIHPGAGDLKKRWAKENFAFLADKLVKEYRAKIVIFGSGLVRVKELEGAKSLEEVSEIKLAQSICSLMEEKAINLAGQLSLKEIGLFLKLTRSLYIGNDTGPAHLSAIVGSPTVTIFGPTDYRLWKPFGKKSFVARKDLECSPCRNPECESIQCLRELSVEEVFKVVEEAIRAGSFF